MTTSQFCGQILAALDILGALLVMVLAASTNDKLICGFGFILLLTSLGLFRRLRTE